MNASKRNLLERKYKVINLVLAHYSQAQSSLQYNTPWELLVAVILSAQCTDLLVNRVTKQLFAKYTSLDAYVHANAHEFEQDILSTGFYKNKTKHILATATIVKEKYNGILPNTMNEMLTLPGVARKTANIVLGTIYKTNTGIPVDTHVLRISQRLRLVTLQSLGGRDIQNIPNRNKAIIDYIKDASPEKIESELITLVPSQKWLIFSHAVIQHGRVLCKARNPICSSCFLTKYCPVTRI